MELKQLLGDEFELNQSRFSAKQAEIQTALPGTIISFNPIEMTCSVQPAIQGIQFSDTGSSPINLPVLVDCPVVFPRGGGCTITFPIKKGDECLIIFSSRCIDGWWQLSGMSGTNITPRPQLEMRMHDLSDGFVIPGPSSQPRVLSSISTTAIEIRSDNRDAVISLNPTSYVIQINTASSVNITSTGNTNITAPTTAITGNLTVSGTIIANGNITGGGISLDTHVHSDPQGGNTGGPH